MDRARDWMMESFGWVFFDGLSRVKDFTQE
jgi:hypothetical protein